MQLNRNCSFGIVAIFGMDDDGVVMMVCCGRSYVKDGKELWWMSFEKLC